VTQATGRRERRHTALLAGLRLVPYRELRRLNFTTANGLGAPPTIADTTSSLGTNRCANARGEQATKSGALPLFV